MKRVTSRRGLRILMPTTAIVLFSFMMVLLAACGDSSATPVPSTTSAASSPATSEATATAASTTTAAATTDASATTPATATTAPATTASATSSSATASGATSTSSTTPGASSSTTAKGKNTETAKGTIESFDSSTGTLAVKETNGQTADFNASKATIVGVSKISLADLSKLSFTDKTVEFSAQPGSNGSYTPTALTILDQPAMSNTAKGNGKSEKTKKAGGSASSTAAATDTPAATTSASTPSNRVVLHNISLTGNTLTGTSASGTTVTVNLSDTTTLNQRVSEKTSDLAAGDKLTVDYRSAGKKATSPANAIAIVIEK